MVGSGDRVFVFVYIFDKRKLAWRLGLEKVLDSDGNEILGREGVLYSRSMAKFGVGDTYRLT